MILDTSAVIAIIQREPGWQQIRSQLEEATLLQISAGTLQELLVVAHCCGVLDAVEELLLLLDADVVPVDEDLARRARSVSHIFVGTAPLVPLLVGSSERCSQSRD